MQEKRWFFSSKTLVKSLFHFQNHWYGLGLIDRPEFWKALSNGDTTLQIKRKNSLIGCLPGLFVCIGWRWSYLTYVKLQCILLERGLTRLTGVFFGFWYPDAGVFPNEHFIPFKGLYQPYLLSSLQFNLKNNGPVLFFKAIFSHWNCFLFFVATDGKDGHGLKLEKIGPTFSLSFNTMLANIIKKILYWLLLPDGICLIIISSSNNSIRSFQWVKAQP